MTNIIIFGVGALAAYLTENIREGVDIIAYAATEPDGRKYVLKKPLISISEIDKYAYDYIVVAFGDSKEGRRQLLEAGIDNHKILAYFYESKNIWGKKELQAIVDDALDKVTDNEIITKLFTVKKKKYYVCTMNIGDMGGGEISGDYVRQQTLGMIAAEINRKNLRGEMAELGVFKGMFSSKMNLLFPDKKLYLFDTFEGFPEQSISEKDYTMDKLPDNNFSDTSVSKVLDNMPFSEKCIVKKGYFPDTYDLDDTEEFCLVSLDVDLYESIYSGLEVFYPRLVAGGYIMIHDYNNLSYCGTKMAVQEYCDSHGISYVPIADVAGSVIITK